MSKKILEPLIEEAERRLQSLRDLQERLNDLERQLFSSHGLQCYKRILQHFAALAEVLPGTGQAQLILGSRSRETEWAGVELLLALGAQPDEPIVAQSGNEMIERCGLEVSPRLRVHDQYARPMTEEERRAQEAKQERRAACGGAP